MSTDEAFISALLHATGTHFSLTRKHAYCSFRTPSVGTHFNRSFMISCNERRKLIIDYFGVNKTRNVNRKTFVEKTLDLSAFHYTLTL